MALEKIGATEKANGALSPTVHEVVRVMMKNSANVVASWFYYANGFARDPNKNYSVDEAAARRVTRGFE